MQMGIFEMANPTASRTLRAVFAPLYLSASGDWGIPEELRATRKPRMSYRTDGASLLRLADRQPAATLLQQPPRYTRIEPLVCQSSTHSNRFPWMSNKPPILGRSCLVRWDHFSELSTNHPYSPSKLSLVPKL